MKRNRVPELMDDPALPYSSHAEALRGLEKLNVVSTSAASLWFEIRKYARTGTPLRVLDLATGGGDIPIALKLRADADGVDVTIVGADISADAIKYATQMAQKSKAAVEFTTLDVLTQPLPTGFDVVTTSLFTHHLDPPEVTALLTKMAAAASKLVLVNDLVRSEVSYGLVWLATRLFSSSPIVRFDGPVSVNASFTSSELQQMASEAGLRGASVTSCPPCRQLLVWRNNA